MLKWAYPQGKTKPLFYKAEKLNAKIPATRYHESCDSILFIHPTCFKNHATLWRVYSAVWGCNQSYCSSSNYLLGILETSWWRRKFTACSSFLGVRVIAQQLLSLLLPSVSHEILEWNILKCQKEIQSKLTEKKLGYFGSSLVEEMKCFP